MYYLNNLLKVLYLCFAVLFCIFLFFTIAFNIQVGYFLFFNYLIVVIPLLERLLNNILKDFSIGNISFSGFNPLKYFAIFLSFIILFFFSSISLINIFLIVFLLFSVLFLLDSRMSFFIGFSIIVFVPVFLLLENNSLAEKSSVYSYYFFIIGLLVAFFENFFKKESLKD